MTVANDATQAALLGVRRYSYTCRFFSFETSYCLLSLFFPMLSAGDVIVSLPRDFFSIWLKEQITFI